MTFENKYPIEHHFNGTKPEIPNVYCITRDHIKMIMASLSDGYLYSDIDNYLGKFPGTTFCWEIQGFLGYYDEITG